MIWLEAKYASLLSVKLQQFKVKNNNPYLANFRCPICNDSQKDKFKKRGYIYQFKNDLRMKCWNCSASMSFSSFLQKIDTVLYNEYIVEKYRNLEEQPKAVTEVSDPILLNGKYSQFTKAVKKISSLPWDHPAKLYVSKRKIPNDQHFKIFWVDNFAAFTNSFLPNKLPKRNEGRLVFPLVDEDSKLFGFQGRSIDPDSKRKYITIMLDEEHHKIYGLDTVNKNKKIYVVEGIIDSLFLPNAVASLQGDLLLVRKLLPEKRLVFIPDRDVRNREIMKLTEKLIESELSVALLPPSLKGKDINEIVLSGMPIEELRTIITQNTYSGLEAKLQFASWCKISLTK